MQVLRELFEIRHNVVISVFWLLARRRRVPPSFLREQLKTLCTPPDSRRSSHPPHLPANRVPLDAGNLARCGTSAPAARKSVSPRNVARGRRSSRRRAGGRQKSPRRLL